MADSDLMLITDNRFQSGVSCPLKLTHIRENRSNKKEHLPFRQRNKLRLRDFFATTLPDLYQTSNDTETAASETGEVLSKPGDVTILGAVLRHENFVSRVPLLRREDDRFTIWQLHGKLRRRSDPFVIAGTYGRRAEQVYLLKASFRLEVLRRLYPDADCKINLVFPQRGFRAGLESLSDQRWNNLDTISEEIADEAKRLFAVVDATDAVEQMSESLTDEVAHPKFAGRSVANACEVLSRSDIASGNPLQIKINKACGYCGFRRSEKEGEKGCWETYFFDETLSEPDRHIFELIGHGNSDESENGSHFQEQVPKRPGGDTFEAIRLPRSPSISISQRRMLQLAQARGEQIPGVWIKPGLLDIKKLNYPLHFIDFEAATYAIPMLKGQEPYKPLLFQFSCHSLSEDGTLSHTSWLDQGRSGNDQHEQFTQKLMSVPDIWKGTLIQYSPFESQALHSLVREFRQKGGNGRERSEELRKFINGGSGVHNRIFDISRSLRDYYFNGWFRGSLGLKETLQSVLAYEKEFAGRDELQVKLAGKEIDLLSEKNGTAPDPYGLIQHPDIKVDEGAVAMNAYIAMRNGLLSPDESELLPGLLNRYCCLDTYALVIIWNHLMELLPKLDEDDLVIF
ncbi:MAG: DUF2779 domain-containing protein [Balneolaceae bacterium]|nr:DUF2779 domain-containing protein [Balneolaceae bacterium]MCH8547507.1 DUF2779 domain-containing protein [Balneolaceae bacterium]